MNKIKYLILLTLVTSLFSCRTKKRITANTYIFVATSGKDVTKTLQSAIDYTIKKGIDTLFIPKGTYYINSVNIYPGLVYLGEKGTIFKKTPYAGKWSRMFTTQKYPYKGKKDSEYIVFKNLRFDGNKNNQGQYKKYQLQQQHLLYFNADPTMPGRVRAKIENCTFVNSVADGISLWQNANVTVLDCEAYNVFRGGVVATGGHSKLLVKGFKAGGKDDVTGIDIEIDAIGYGGKKDIEVYLEDLQLEGDFDIGMPQEGLLIANNIQVTGPRFFLNAANNGKVKISNSSFVIGKLNQHQLYFPSDVTFKNCNFVVLKSDEYDTGLRIFMETSYRRKGDHKLIFDGCKFITKGRGKKKAYGLYNIENFTHLESNWLILKNCIFDGDFDASIYFSKGGNLELENVTFEKGNGIIMNSVNGKMPMKIKGDKIIAGKRLNKLFIHENPSIKDKIRIKKIINKGLNPIRHNLKKGMVDKIVNQTNNR